MSMFFLEINPQSKALRWVRAGHEPALVYNRIADTFSELDGKGMALGVDDAFIYEEFSRDGWHPNDIIFIGTDGIHETRNDSDQMFGQHRLQTIIQQHADTSAKNIKDKVISSVQDFRGPAPQEDDVTLVVIKFL